MRQLVLVSFLFLLANTLNSNALYASVRSKETQRLESYVGKYPSDLLKGVPSIKRRLRTLLGPNYSFFMNRLQTEVPIENDEGALVARGCMAHQCTVEEAVLVINLADGKLHCAILSEKFGRKYKVFSEDKARIPNALKRAMEQQ